MPNLPSSYTDYFAELQGIPDATTFRLCPWNPKFGLAFIDLVYTDGNPLELCHRTLLTRAIKQLKEEF